MLKNGKVTDGNLTAELFILVRNMITILMEQLINKMERRKSN